MTKTRQTVSLLPKVLVLHNNNQHHFFYNCAWSSNRGAADTFKGCSGEGVLEDVCWWRCGGGSGVIIEL